MLGEISAIGQRISPTITSIWSDHRLLRRVYFNDTIIFKLFKL